jgi:hypothetical protein
MKLNRRQPPEPLSGNVFALSCHAEQTSNEMPKTQANPPFLEHIS